VAEVAGAIFVFLLLTPIIAIGLVFLLLGMFFVGVFLYAIGSAICSIVDKELERREPEKKEKSTVDDVVEYLNSKR